MQRRARARSPSRSSPIPQPGAKGTTRPSSPCFHLHPDQRPPPPPKHPWAKGATAANGACDLEGRVQHIARPLHSPPPLLQQGQVQSKDWAWVCRSLTRGKGDSTRCFVNLPHTLLMAGGSPNGCWAFTSAQHGVVLRKRAEHATDLAHLQAEFLRSAAASPTPLPLVPCTAPAALSSSFSLPAALVQAGVDPEAVVALLQGDRGGSGGSAAEQRLISALELVQMCQSGAFPSAARTLQAYVPERGARVAPPGAEGSPTLVPGSTFQLEYSLSRHGAPLNRSFRCVSRSLFGHSRHKAEPGGSRGGGGSAVRKSAMVASSEEDGGDLRREDSKALNRARAQEMEVEMELLPSTHRALNQAMAAAAQQVVMHVEGASGGGRVQRLVCEFVLDGADKLWLRRTLACEVLAVAQRVEGKGGKGSRASSSNSSSSNSPPRHPHRRVRSEKDGDVEEEDEAAELPSTLPSALQPLPGHRIEERVGRRQARREAAVDEDEVARILGAG